ncbi:MAG: hypothetical protein M5U25_10985 [Planctomycetota bacterium]|nr:hypothetical protein [Planctomycetota bacterium]
MIRKAGSSSGPVGVRGQADDLAEVFLRDAQHGLGSLELLAARGADTGHGKCAAQETDDHHAQDQQDADGNHKLNEREAAGGAFPDPVALRLAMLP